jgi:hypothetical protein
LLAGELGAQLTGSAVSRSNAIFPFALPVLFVVGRVARSDAEASIVRLFPRATAGSVDHALVIAPRASQRLHDLRSPGGDVVRLLAPS